jgi:6-pyruvoyl-tetrahydropterin synthase
MFQVTKEAYADFAHFIPGHEGPCMNIHGHTWRLAITVGSPSLDPQGMVVDFGILKEKILRPMVDLLDHSLVVYGDLLNRPAFRSCLEGLGIQLSALSRKHPQTTWPRRKMILGDGSLYLFGGIRIVAFPWAPSSERLARWLYEEATQAIESMTLNCQMIRSSVCEGLHPTVSEAIFEK